MINIKYTSKKDFDKLKEIKDLEDLKTNPQLLAFLLENYFSSKNCINNLKMQVLRQHIKP